MRGIGRNRKSTNRRVLRSRRLAPHPRGPRANFARQGQTSISRGKRSGDAERASLCFGNWPNPAMFSICSKAPLVRPPSASQKQTDAAPSPPLAASSPGIACFLRKSSERRAAAKGKNRPNYSIVIWQSSGET